MWRLLLPALIIPPALAAGSRAADLAQALRSTAIDPEQCYRVRDLSFAREDLKIYFTDGFLAFARPVNGRIFAAVFTAEVEGGDGEVLLLPPLQSERISLASFTQTPNLEEHFRSALLIFTDGTADELHRYIRDRQTRPTQEMGLLLAQSWDSVVRNMVASFEVRIVADLLENAASRRGIFYMGVTGSRLGNFDVFYDPQSREQISVGQVTYRDNRAYFDTWTSFESRQVRKGGVRTADIDFAIADIQIDAALSATLELKAITRIHAAARRGPLPVLGFDISRAMRVTSAKVNGRPAEVFQRESLRSNLIRAANNDMFLVVPEAPIEPGQTFEVELEHEGDVIINAGNGVYYVAARGTWYPHHGLQFAIYDLAFRYPKQLSVVTAGDIVDERTEEEFRYTRRRTKIPIRLAGFNLGEYSKYSSSRGGLTVDVYANRKIEIALQQQRQRDLVIVQPPGNMPRPGRRPGDIVAIPTPEPANPNPAARAQLLATEMSDAFEFLSARFGTPPLTNIAVSPIPGTFGQGFPGLIYLSTLSYIDPREFPAHLRNTQNQLFFTELLHAHEVAHQWWGNKIISGGYHHDWLMEAFANYSAVLYIEKKKGVRALQAIMDTYRKNLLAKDSEGRTLESAGPLDFGIRLHSSISPNSWRTIVYEKGAWVLHMLRRTMGDMQFNAMLIELVRLYDQKPLTTDEFQALCARFLPQKSPDPRLETFFDLYVHSTGIPSLRLTYSIKGKAPRVTVSGTLRQSDVTNEFSVFVPVEFQFARGKTEVHWLRTDNEGTPFSYTFPSPPLKVLLDPADSTLTVKR